jgi:catechol 2,3-dioxygenase-like lactoylglutathione lyase family enzyme
MARVTSLRYIGLAAPNFDEAVAYYTDAVGLERVEHEPGVAFFAAEGSPEQFVVRLRKAPEKRVDLVAFGVDSAQAADELAGALAADGVRFVSEPGRLQTPGGGYGFRFFDPDGRVVEVSSDVARRPHRTIEEREAIPTKLSHVVFHAPDVERTQTFYEEKLGFRVSDCVSNSMCFMRCATDQHSVALFQGKDGAMNHVAFELRGIDEFMRATGRVLRSGAVLRNGPGRFAVSGNTYSFFWDPNGNVTEMTSMMEQIPADINFTPRYAEAAGDLWDTARTADKVPESALVPETGYWQAPPI